MSAEITEQMRRANGRVDGFTERMLARLRRANGVTRMAIIVLIAFGFFTIMSPRVFLTGLNLQNMLLAVPEIGILAIAMMIAMLTGGIDLSLVSIANLCAITISTTYSAIALTDPGRAEAMAPLIIVLGVLVGTAAGAFNGVLIAYVGVTPILATLGTMQIFNGLAVVWTGGKTLYGSPESLTAFGKTAIAGIPVLFLVFLAVALVVGFLINKTPLGLGLSLQGSNPVAARFSGIKSTRLLMRSYVLTGMLGAITGVMFISRNPTASADYGASYVLLVIVIAVLGGTNPNGGFATVTGVFLAAMTLQIVQSGFTALRLSTFQYSIAQGVILIAVLVIDRIDWASLIPRLSSRTS
ncbi:ABC transporter permease [Actinomyces sp. B33]|uniref:ABC transporter permease n=1 Tax=Actinomyces sp. B33 TaxID=2942131 RepID=UPI002340479F|nr:ABC transporter permease [Actinomyces sp. B33]MDC4232499.1 ABC transporter permease [Actinomyces sp. B33]